MGPFYSLDERIASTECEHVYLVKKFAVITRFRDCKDIFLQILLVSEMQKVWLIDVDNTHTSISIQLPWNIASVGETNYLHLASSDLEKANMHPLRGRVVWLQSACNKWLQAN